MLKKYNNFKDFSDLWILNFYVVGLPVILFFEWMYSFGNIATSFAVYIKLFSLILFIYLYILRFNYIKKFEFHNLLIFFLIIYFCYSLLSNDIAKSLYRFLQITYWVFGTFIFFYFHSIYPFFMHKINKAFVAIVLIGSYFTFLLMSISQGNENANAYILTWILPVFFYFKRSFLNGICQVIIIFSVFITAKRGAIIALVLSIVVYFVFSLRISKSLSDKSFSIITLSIFLFISVIAFSLNEELLTERFMDKSGASRLVLYTPLIEEAINSTPKEIIFGRGLYSVENFTNYYFRYFASRFDNSNLSAHSDWLQLFFDFGIIGIFFMLYMNYKILKILFFNYKYKNSMFPLNAMIYIIYFLVSIYSIHIYSINSIYFGMLLAIVSNEKNKFILESKY